MNQSADTHEVKDTPYTTIGYRAIAEATKRAARDYGQLQKGTTPEVYWSKDTLVIMEFVEGDTLKNSWSIQWLTSRRGSRATTSVHRSPYLHPWVKR